MPTAILHTKISINEGQNGSGTESISHTISTHLSISNIKIEGSGHVWIYNYTGQQGGSAILTIKANNIEIYKQTFTNIGGGKIFKSFSFNVTSTNPALFYSTLNFVAFVSAWPYGQLTLNADISRTVNLSYASAGSVIHSNFLDAPWALYKMSHVSWSHAGSALTHPADTNWTSGAYTATMTPVGNGTTVQAKAVNALIDTICTRTSNTIW